MKRFVKYTLLALIVVATLGLSGCANQGQPRQRKEKFQVVSLDKVNGSIGEGWKITLTVANNTASNMRITNAAASFGIVIQSYGFTLLAEKTSWNFVADMWVLMLGGAALLLIISLPRWKRFIALEKQEETV